MERANRRPRARPAGPVAASVAVFLAAFVAAFLAAAPLSAAPLAAESAPVPIPATRIQAGFWHGSMSLAPTSQNQGGEKFTASLSVELLEPGSGALADLPAQSMFGYPLDEVKSAPNRLSFILGALGPGEELKFDGMFAAKGREGFGSIVGSVAGRSWRGTFMLSLAIPQAFPGESEVSFAVEGGTLPGTLLVPAGSGTDAERTRVPLVVFISGAGAVDRDGNNFSVPGRNDAVAMLARALAGRGIASLRYDKRGTGKAYALAESEATLPYGAHIRDAAAAISAARKMGAWPRLLVAGMNEGSWIGAAALNGLAGADAWADGLVALAASGKSPVNLVRESFAGLDSAVAREAESIVAAILEGKAYPEPSPQLADFFNPERRERLSSWLGFDPAFEFALVPTPLFLVFGGSDLQAPASDFDLMLKARPSAAAFTVPGMNHSLKDVGTDEEANYDAFSDPKFPLPAALVDLLESFAWVRPAPEGTMRYGR